MGYGYLSDVDVPERGFLDKNKILKYVSERDIYKLVFGFKPKEYQYVTSPLRVDRHPGCWFETTRYGLVFRDFAYKNRPLDCFDVVQEYFKLSNFYTTLKFIDEKLIQGREVEQRQIIHTPVQERKVKIHFESRNFIRNDAKYWKDFQISKQNLIEDKVFPFTRFQILNSKNGDKDYKFRDLAYAFTDFKDGRKKLYFPKRDNRFVTNCKKDDIGNINNLIPYGKQLIITKSYKDCRVLRNQGKNSIWIQNEGMIPNIKLIASIVKRFERVSIFYDNDSAGINASVILSEIINKYFPGKSSPMWLNQRYIQQDISDPAELIHKCGRRELNQILDML